LNNIFERKKEKIKKEDKKNWNASMNNRPFQHASQTPSKVTCK